MDIRQAFGILGVDWSADTDQLKTAYHALCLEHHPDKGGTAQAFIALQAAYKLIRSNPKRHGPVQDDVRQDEFTVRDGLWIYDCRCGGSFIIDKEDLDLGIGLVECDSCSSCIKVIY